MLGPKYLGSYEIFPSGEIYSFSGWRGYKKRKLVFFKDSHGYSEIRLTINGKRKKWKVHKLIAELFLKKKPSRKHEIRHLDGNKSHNYLSNLSWGTRKDNANDREKHGRTSRGVSHSKYIKKGIANSRLIAAAPDLLEACKEAQEVIKAQNGGDTLVKLDEAIEKAEAG